MTRRIDSVASAVDAVLYTRSSQYLDYVRGQAKEKARTDPEYARLEALRSHKDGWVLSDPQTGLGWDEWEYQMAVESAYTRKNRRLRVALWANGNPLTKRFNKYIAQKQRIQRGWDFRAIWGLDHHLASTLGPQLHVLAETLKDRDLQWLDEVRAAGDSLVRYSQKDDDSISEPLSTQELLEREKELGISAKDALYWVAENLSTLSASRQPR